MAPVVSASSPEAKRKLLSIISAATSARSCERVFKCDFFSSLRVGSSSNTRPCGAMHPGTGQRHHIRRAFLGLQDLGRSSWPAHLAPSTACRSGRLENKRRRMRGCSSPLVASSRRRQCAAPPAAPALPAPPASSAGGLPMQRESEAASASGRSFMPSMPVPPLGASTTIAFADLGVGVAGDSDCVCWDFEAQKASFKRAKTFPSGLAKNLRFTAPL
mmetsp:Transcript_97126/g.279555  ORF Transcript_97126/g.279555 Transcript_97126/m.279555 type:complete len:217 (-) Transcript_97126:234-884(-)